MARTGEEDRHNSRCDDPNIIPSKVIDLLRIAAGRTDKLYSRFLELAWKLRG